ncbi:polysaccharide pyruvyl transferase family protein [Roseomonas sp. WA12]
MNEDIRGYLAQFSGSEVMFLPNPGNAGDSLMSSATYQAFDKLGIRYRIPHLGSFDPAGKVVLYGGGGNLYEKGRHSYRTLERIHRTAKRLVILPHTIKDVDDLLDAFGSNVTVICREPVSHDYVRGRGGRYETLLMEDLAFSLDVEQLLNGAESFNATAMLTHFLLQKVIRRDGHTSFDNVRRYMAPGPVAARLLARPPGGVLNCFRRDGEATDIPIPEDNVDLPIVFMYGVSPAPVAHHASRSLLRTLMSFDEIRTNRLHVAIAAGLLGRPTRLYTNNYYKIRAIYEFSMRHRFPHVTWMS